MSQKNIAKRNLIIMWFANFLFSGSMTMILPFLSLYIETFGDFSQQYVQTWSGITYGVTFVTAFLFTPIWGKIGDRYGRKRILIFSGLGMTTSLFLMGHVGSVFQLFILRFCMGIFTGFIAMSQAYISTQTPKKIAGRVLGTLQTGSITGSLMGPLLGGALADQFGYATIFSGTSVLLFSAAMLVIATKEFRVEEKKGTQKFYSSKEVLRLIFHNPIMITVLLISALVQIANFSIQPILSLYVSKLHGPENIALFSGIAFSAAGFGNLLMARKWGSLGDQYGYIKLLVVLLFGAGIVYLPAAFVTNIWQLVVIRFFLGITIGGIIPVRVAYIRQVAPVEMQGEVMGYNTSLQFLGNVIGPAIGGIISGFFGFSAVFFSTTALLIISGLILYTSMQRHPKLVKTSA
ncbi:MFS transporter [Bacillaceae bacterium Marseille-Q3522]|nr:MFS transporter [Bacillaceae bacterium Marseille-Q3522]